MAAAIAQRATARDGRSESFLIGRLLALSARGRTEPVDITSPGWQSELPASVAEAFDEDLARLGDKEPLARALLTALAWAKGPGLPWENIWVPVARALAETRRPPRPPPDHRRGRAVAARQGRRLRRGGSRTRASGRCTGRSTTCSPLTCAASPAPSRLTPIPQPPTPGSSGAPAPSSASPTPCSPPCPPTGRAGTGRPPIPTCGPTSPSTRPPPDLALLRPRAGCGLPRRGRPGHPQPPAGPLDR